METKIPKAPDFIPQSRSPTDIERQDSPGTPPPTDASVQNAVEKVREEGSGG